ncbi:hypothetical protein AAFF_G00016660 [Aldrovandia affinis]|uniref:Uncharacterized protein n=1 Tax=Aldrovandia affinis TaxID=143900 RepID=A0AAD7WHA7_9TELE|nr:hypothetical protein AAFF_G00016660 [Aldrovandia affinis]
MDLMQAGGQVKTGGGRTRENAMAPGAGEPYTFSADYKTRALKYTTQKSVPGKRHYTAFTAHTNCGEALDWVTSSWGDCQD